MNCSHDLTNYLLVILLSLEFGKLIGKITDTLSRRRAEDKNAEKLK